MNNLLIEDWLNEADIPSTTSPGDPFAGQAPVTDPYNNQMPPDMGGQNLGNQAAPQDDPSAANPIDNQMPDDVTSDPQAPDMPDEKSEDQDFEVWKNKYFKESIVGDSNKLIDMISPMRERELLDPYQRKFVEDNWNIQLIRQNANIDKASKEIRKLIKDQLDKNNPSTSLVNHITSVIETMPMLNNIFIKLNGYTGLKGDLHRKFLAGLLGAVQVGSGANTEDIIVNEKEYSIMTSTRFNARWGDVMIGNWSLKEDDPQRYLSQPELKKLEEGSPEERDVLRRRIVVESISKQFETRSFIINVISEDGTIYFFGWDLASCLRSAYADGKIIVKTKSSDNSEAMIDDNGQIIPLVELDLFYVKDTGNQDEDGKPEKKELPLLERKNGVLFLNANLNTIRDAASGMPGTIFKEVPYRGNPSDLKTLVRCVYSAHDLLMRQC